MAIARRTHLFYVIFQVTNSVPAHQNSSRPSLNRVFYLAARNIFPSNYSCKHCLISWVPFAESPVPHLGLNPFPAHFFSITPLWNLSKMLLATFTLFWAQCRGGNQFHLYQGAACSSRNSISELLPRKSSKNFGCRQQIYTHCNKAALFRPYKRTLPRIKSSASSVINKLAWARIKKSTKKLCLEPFEVRELLYLLDHRTLPLEWWPFPSSKSPGRKRILNDLGVRTQRWEFVIWVYKGTEMETWGIPFSPSGDWIVAVLCGPSVFCTLHHQT